jgi:pimeloyl-ACP methyl ester carboxylesterase
MPEPIDRRRLLILGVAVSGGFAMESTQVRATDGGILRLEPLRSIDAGALNISYYEAGPADGPAVVLLHGFPYDIHAYVDVAAKLAAKGSRVIVPYLRGYGPTRFLDKATARSGEQAAMGADVMALMVALKIQRAVFAG